MNEFLLIYRRDADFDTQFTAEQLQEISKPWMDWMGGPSGPKHTGRRGNPFR